MDGNLLDSENADATLAKEWSLPELPPGTEKVNFMESFYLFIIFFARLCSVLFNVHQYIATSNKTRFLVVSCFLVV